MSKKKVTCRESFEITEEVFSRSILELAHTALVFRAEESGVPVPTDLAAYREALAQVLDKAENSVHEFAKLQRSMTPFERASALLQHLALGRVAIQVGAVERGFLKEKPGTYN